MVITLIFILFFLAVAIAWFGKRTESIYIFTIALIMAIASFIHHMTDTIGLSL